MIYKILLRLSLDRRFFNGRTMKNTLERLRHRIDVYSKADAETEFGEQSYDYAKLCSVWAEIVPSSGRENTLPGKSVQAAVTHKITTRMGAIKEPRNDMYFVFKGQRYEVLYFMPHYKRNDLVEYYTKLFIETEEDYGTE